MSKLIGDRLEMAKIRTTDLSGPQDHSLWRARQMEHMYQFSLTMGNRDRQSMVSSSKEPRVNEQDPRRKR